VPRSRFAAVAACVSLSWLAHPAAAATATSAKHAKTAPAARATAPEFARDLPDQAFYQRMVAEVGDACDTTLGGFVRHSGAPCESAIELALLLGRREGQEAWAASGIRTVNTMLALEDSLSGGFYVRKESSPGDALFDRPMIENARRLENLVDAWQLTGNTRYWVVGVRVLEFANRNMEDGRGGFTTNPVGDQDLIPEVNGVAIHAWLRWWAIARETRKRDFALRSIDRVWATCWQESLGLVRTSFEQGQGWPRLADQVEMGRALALSAHLVGRASDLARARKIADLLLVEFADGHGGFMSVAERNRKGQLRHGSSGARENGRAALFLVEMAHVAHEPRYLAAARQTWRAFEKSLRKARLDSADWALALDAVVAPNFPAKPSDGPGDPRNPAKDASTKDRSRFPDGKVGVETR